MDEQAIFLAALDLPNPEARARWLQQACGPDTALQARVQALLANFDDAGSFLEHPPSGVLAGDTQLDGGAASDVTPASTGGERTSLEPDSSTGPAAGLSSADLSCLGPSPTPGSLGMIGSYDVQSLIGRGGMGLVFRARDVRLNRMAAIKVLAPELASSPLARRRFIREGQAAAAVSHPHVVTIYAVDEDRTPYLVMELIEGQSLKEKVDRQGPLPLKEILRIGSQIGYGLAAAHKQGLIHRDIKPANILLENGVERVKLTDFGLARAADDASVTRTGEVDGTPQFMSPEQAQGEVVDQRSDLFSLGSVLYTMAAGRPPFRGENPVVVLRKVCDEAPRPLRELNPDVPDALAEIIDKLLQKRPADRFQSAREVADLLNAHLAHLQQPETTPPPPRLAPSASASSPRRQFWDWVIGLSLLLIGAWWCGPGIVLTVGNRAELSADLPDGVVVLVHEGDNTAATPLFDGSTVQFAPGRYTLNIETPPGAQLTQWSTEERRWWGQYSFTSRGLESRELILARGAQVEIDVDLQRAALAALETKKPESQEPPEPSTLEITGEVRRPSGFTLNEQVWSVGFSPDSRRIIAGTWGGGLQFIDRDTGQIDPGPPLAFPFVTRVKVLPDGKYVLTGQGEIRMFDPARPDWTQRFACGEKMIWQVSASADGKLLAAGGEDGVIYRWHVEEGARPALAVHPGTNVSCLALSADGRWLANGGHDNKVHLWDLAEGKDVAQLNDIVTRELSFSTDGATVYAASTDARIYSWSWRDGHIGATMSGHTAPVTSVAVLPDGRIASASEDLTVRLWDPATPTELATFTGHTDKVTHVVVSPDGRWLASAGLDHKVILFPVPEGAETASPPDAGQELLQARSLESPFTATGEAIRAAAITPDGSRIVTGQFLHVGVWDARTEQRVAWKMAHTLPVTAVACLPDNQHAVTGGEDGRVCLWNVQSGEFVGEFPRQFGPVRALAPLLNGERVLCCSGSNAARQPSELHGLRVSTRDVEWRVANGLHADVVAVSPDGVHALVIDVYRDRLQLWRITDGAVLQDRAADGASAAAWSPEGVRFAAAGWSKPSAGVDSGSPVQGVIRIYDSGFRPERELRGHLGEVTHLVWLPQGRLASASGLGFHMLVDRAPPDMSLRVWDVDQGALLAQYPLEQAIHRQQGFGDGAILTASDRVIQLWSTPSGPGAAP